MADDFVLSLPHPYAVYLPAVNSSYAQVGRLNIPKSRPRPANLSLADFDFWTGKSNLWNHKALLHSIGNYSVFEDTRGPLFARSPGAFTMVGDSGGFQIGKGAFEGFKGLRAGMKSTDAVNVWSDSYEEKKWIINWLDQYCDLAMTIDMPLWATLPRGSNSPFHSCTEAQLLEMTNDNLRLIEQLSHRDTKWLNVIQATNLADGLRWWHGVKWFRRGGWSLGGVAGWRGGLYIMLTILLTMRDDGAFERGQDWLHVLGVSQMRWDIFLTAIQNGLRRTNPNLQVSFDSATAFKQGGQFDEYAVAARLGPAVKDWTIKFNKVEHLRSLANSSTPTPFPEPSPLGSQLSMHHLVTDNSEFAGRRIDTLSNYMLINHSLWVYLDTGRRANAAAFGVGKRNIPDLFASAIDIIDQAFMVESWQSFLDQQKVALDAAAECQD